MGHLFQSEHDSGSLNSDQSWGHLLLKWILSGIQPWGSVQTQLRAMEALLSSDIWSGTNTAGPPSSIPPRWNQYEWPCRPNKTRQLQRNNSEQTNPETFRSLLVSAWLCVRKCVFQSSCQHQTITSLTLGSQASWLWKHGNPLRRKTGSCSTRTWFSYIWHAHMRRHTHPWDPRSGACQTLTPVIICPDAEVWTGVITSELWFLPRGLNRTRTVPCV